MKVVVYPNFSKNSAKETAVEVIKKMQSLNVEISMDESCKGEFEAFSSIQYGDFSELAKTNDFAIVLGGDGTILKCARRAYGTDLKIVGINTGHLGFMSAMEKDELHLLDKLISGDYTCSQRMLISAKTVKDHQVQEMIALNEIQATVLNGHIGNYSVYVDDNLVGVYRADGLIFSTPTGSTAYALSAGGPVIEPGISCIEMVVVCPHSLYDRPMIFSAEHTIKVVHSCKEQADMYVFADGKTPVQLKSGEELYISKSLEKVNIVDRLNGTFFDTLSQKLMKPLKNVF